MGSVRSPEGTTRRRILRSGAAPSVLVPGIASLGSSPRDDSGIVWSRRSGRTATQGFLDVTRGPGKPFVFCGYAESGDGSNGVVAPFDWGGRPGRRHRGSQWGDRADDLVAREDGYLLAGVDDGDPMLAVVVDRGVEGTDGPFDQDWRGPTTGRRTGRSTRPRSATGTPSAGRRRAIRQVRWWSGPTGRRTSGSRTGPVRVGA